MTLYEYLLKMPESMPSWLESFKGGDGFDRNQFFSSRIVFYPGAGTDGQAVKVFGSTHSAHTFVYADYGISQDELESELGQDAQHKFMGYHTLVRLNLSQHDILPDGWISHIKPEEIKTQEDVQSFGFLEVLERDAGLSDDHGASRLAILFLGADGIATYDALFCQQKSISPFAVVIQDHGFGGNYDAFGQGGLMERIAERSSVFPQFVLVEDGNAWTHFTRIPEVDGDISGMHRNLRYLHVRSNN